MSAVVNVSPCSVDLGVVSPGSIKGTSVNLTPQAQIETSVRASIINDSSNGGFKVIDLTSYAQVQVEETVPILGHPGKWRKIKVLENQVDQETYGSQLTVFKEDYYINVDVAFTAPYHKWGDFTATLLIQANGWQDVSVPLHALVALVSVTDPNPSDIVAIQGQNVNVNVLATLVGGPNTRVTFQGGPMPPGVSMDNTTAALILGSPQQVTLSFHVSSTAQVGSHQQISIYYSAFNGGETGTLAKYITINILPLIRSISPLSGTVPMLGMGGTLVTITGQGFAQGTTITFGIDSPVAPNSISADGTSIIVSVPPTAASGSITVMLPSGTALQGPNFAVDNYRNTRGLSFGNSAGRFLKLADGSYSFDDATALFGAHQTGSGAAINVKGPFVWAFLGVADLFLGPQSGLCWGMVDASLKFASGQFSSNSFPQQPPNSEPNGPAGPNVWTLNGPPFDSNPPANVSPDLVTLIRQRHMSQFSQEAINTWVSFHVNNVTTAAGLRNAIQQAFTAGGANGMGAIITLNPSIDEGHAVVAFGIVDTGNGNFDIHVYNPNVQFRPNEDSDSILRSTNAGKSIIRVTNNGNWTLLNSAAIFVPPVTKDWTGGIFNITVFPWNAIPLQPTFPWAEVIAGTLLASVIVYAAGKASLSQISDGKGHMLLANGQWNVDPATMLEGVRPMPNFGGLGKKIPPSFVSNRLSTLTHTITPQGAGNYDFYWIGGENTMSLTDVPTTPGGNDTIITNKGNLNFIPYANKAVTMTVLGKGTRINPPRTAILKTTASAGAQVGLSFNPITETFAYLHSGDPTSYILQFSSFDSQGKSATVTTPTKQVTDGDTLTFNPDWNNLAAGRGTVIAKSADGSIKNHKFV